MSHADAGPSGPADGPDLIDELRKEAERQIEDSLHSEKSHFEAGARYAWLHLSVGVLATITTAVAATLAAYDHKEVAAILGAVGAAGTAILTFVKASERGERHRTSGVGYLKLRGKLRRYVNLDLNAGVAVSKLRRTLEHMCEAKDKLNASAPEIPRWAFKRGRKGIEAGEAQHAVDTKKHLPPPPPTLH